MFPLTASPYFMKPYKDSDKLSVMTRTIDGKFYTVYRPNHGLAHSIRQGLLARDMILLLTRHSLSCSCGINTKMVRYLQKRIENDPNFITKVSLLSSYQRSGRESEVSSSSDPQLYRSYEQKDCVNFLSSAKLPKEEKEELVKCLKWETNNVIASILKAAHLLDLRRIPSFDKSRIIGQVAKHLSLESTHYIIRLLWNQSGKYLRMSGDRDLEKQKIYWSNRFFFLQQDPMKLLHQLTKVSIR